MIKRIKESELPSIEELDVEVLVIEYYDYFEAKLGDERCIGKSERDALNHLTEHIKDRCLFINSHLTNIPLLRLL